MLALVAGQAAAQPTPFQVKDLATSAGAAVGSAPSGLVVMGGKAYFSGAKLEFKAFYDVKITRRPPDPTKEKEAPGKTGWIVSWPAWPDEGEFKRHRFF